MDEETVLAGRVTAAAMAAMLGLIESGEVNASEFDRGYIKGALGALVSLGLYTPRTAPEPDAGQPSTNPQGGAAWHS